MLRRKNQLFQDRNLAVALRENIAQRKSDRHDPSGSETAAAYRLECLAQAHRIFAQRAPQAPSCQASSETFIATGRTGFTTTRFTRAAAGILGRAWYQWPAPLRDRDRRRWRRRARGWRTKSHGCALEQFAFARQWQALRPYAAEHGVLLFGDMPIFVAHRQRGRVDPSRPLCAR